MTNLKIDNDADESVKNQAVSVRMKLDESEDNTSDLTVWAGGNHVRVIFPKDSGCLVDIPVNESIMYVQSTKRGRTYVGIEA